MLPVLSQQTQAYAHCVLNSQTHVHGEGHALSAPGGQSHGPAGAGDDAALGVQGAGRREIGVGGL